MYNTGICFRDGLGVERGLKEAKLWFERAVEKGHGGAYASLGFLYDQGLGVARREDGADSVPTGRCAWQCNGLAQPGLLLPRRNESGFSREFPRRA